MGEETNQAKLVHCIYSSAETVAFSQEDIAKLLKVARKHNAQLDVTGILLYDDGAFFQVLEGDPDAVNALLQKIENDKRHDRVVRIIYEEIEERDFADWTMGHVGVTREDLKQIESLSDFFQSNVYTALDKGKSKMLLEAFKDGKWRSTIS